MIFDNPEVLWSLLVLSVFLFLFFIWGLTKKRKLSILFPSVTANLKRKQIEKYILVGCYHDTPDNFPCPS